MSASSSNVRNERGEWFPDHPVTLAPINMWPPKAGVLAKWFVGFPGFLWPYNSLWLAITLVTWFFLTPPLAAMQSFELWWLSWLLVRNLVLVTLVFGGLHAYFYIL